jgi:L-lactate dehydrogenase complex protein LldG
MTEQVELQEAAASSSRAEVLRRIRSAIRDTPSSDAAMIQAEWNAIPRTFKRSASRTHEEALELLEDRLRDYDATVVRVPAAEVRDAIAAALSRRGKRRLVVPEGLAEAVGCALPEGFDFEVDRGITASELDKFEGVVTASTLAIAETGTIVLQHVPGQGRRAPTLVPDYHLCVVRAQDVVETVPEAIRRLQGTATLAMTFVSGPSATADIEMTRIKGVHGPRFFDVILVV